MERGLDFDVMLLIGSVVFDNLRCFWRKSEEFLPLFRRPIAWAIFSLPLRLILRREGLFDKNFAEISPSGLSLRRREGAFR